MSPSRTVKPSPPEVLFKTGSKVFELERILRRRGHGEQHFLAVRRQPGREPVPVFLQALSLRRGEAFLSREPRARLQETLALSRLLEHPRIARLYGGHEVDDMLYLEWEHVPGYTLDDVAMLPLVYVHSYSEAFLVHVGLQLASLLAFLHGKTDARGMPLGFVHRDLHPQGLRFGPEGALMLTDLGDVFSRLPGRAPSSITRPHGEVYYGAPEVLFGEGADARSDLFSLGLILLELATSLHLYSLPRALMGDLEARLTDADAKRVFQGMMVAAQAGQGSGEYADVVMHAATYRPEDLESLMFRLSPGLRAILHRLLRRERTERYATAEDLEVDLRAHAARLGGHYGGAEAAAEFQRALAATAPVLSAFQMDVGAFPPGSVLHLPTPAA
ncbi:protein kinase domain-containing protein [Corallococcus carmarthensis]|uniref:Serine/threonine protein kinase n=1 Tax=Corallococcus carmarthensis TaxID=2316728 RepID=A0A3A8K666_9BACT|nr:protein kinase [Corallococcus carmarthensis]RKH02777.1 serine/threonine protein kinase [Corallococcus carmarthensis]